MGITHNQGYVILFVMVFLPTLCYTTEEYEPSKATYYGSSSCKAFPFGACGYGLYGKTVNNGYFAGVSKLYKGGIGCGACFHIRCTAPECCEEGVKVVATDHAYNSDDADFVVSPRVFAEMAQPGKERQLLSCENVDIEYTRIPCEYPGKNLMLKLHEHSHYPNYLALILLYQAGIYDVTAVEIYEEASQEWKPCQRAFGAVWNMVIPPKGDLTVRFFVCGGGNAQGKWVVASSVIPASWKPGVVFDTSIQLS